MSGKEGSPDDRDGFRNIHRFNPFLQCRGAGKDCDTQLQLAETSGARCGAGTVPGVDACVSLQ